MEEAVAHFYDIMSSPPPQYSPTNWNNYKSGRWFVNMMAATARTGITLKGNNFVLPAPFSHQSISAAQFGDWLLGSHQKYTHLIEFVDSLPLTHKIAIEVLFHAGQHQPEHPRNNRVKKRESPGNLRFITCNLGRYSFEDETHFMVDVMAFFKFTPTPSSSFPLSRCIKAWITRGQSDQEWKFFIRCAVTKNTPKPTAAMKDNIKIGIKLGEKIKDGTITLIDEDLPEKSLYVRGLDLTSYTLSTYI